jgi:hypothetical protein
VGIGFANDNTFDDHRLGLIVVRGERGLVKVWLREVVAERAQQRGEREDKHLARPGRAPPEDDAQNRQAERDCGRRNARREPNANVKGMSGISLDTPQHNYLRTRRLRNVNHDPMLDQFFAGKYAELSLVYDFCDAIPRGLFQPGNP